MKHLFLRIFAWKYRYIIRPVFFLFDSETIHEFLVSQGELMGRSKIMRTILAGLWQVKDKSLEQTSAGIHFVNPIGLSAGFDYLAQLTQILPSMGFGFGSIGTITQKAYEGNPKPRLGRLVRSRSLMVNKGYKNGGIDQTLIKLLPLQFSHPVGISIGKTNTAEAMTQEQAIEDIIASFRQTEASSIPFSYYELNISCPNLIGNISFYEPERLRELLAAVTALKLAKPLFIKMPIEKNNAETMAMMEVISQFPIAGVIIGNLQKDRTVPEFVPAELAKYPVGNFSGKPTWNRSNELIQLTYQKYGQKLIIIGCGGVFSAEDAYTKIKLGASLIQLITGLIFQGPQLPGQINAGLIELMRRDGYDNIQQAVGVKAK